MEARPPDHTTTGWTMERTWYLFWSNNWWRAKQSNHFYPDHTSDTAHSHEGRYQDLGSAFYYAMGGNGIMGGPVGGTVGEESIAWLTLSLLHWVASHTTCMMKWRSDCTQEEEGQFSRCSISVHNAVSRVTSKFDHHFNCWKGGNLTPIWSPQGFLPPFQSLLLWIQESLEGPWLLPV